MGEFVYAGFADMERAHLDELTLAALEAQAEADMALGHHSEVIVRLEPLCREHPLREGLLEMLIIALYRDRRQAEALRAYREIRDRLVEGLGIDPGATLRELEARILIQDPTLAPADVAPVRSRDDSSPGGNLREQLSSFVGRRAELHELSETLRTCRFVTLVGPGGVGKTRLAVEAAAALGV